jgi:hypothetical protein
MLLKNNPLPSFTLKAALTGGFSTILRMPVFSKNAVQSLDAGKELLVNSCANPTSRTPISALFWAYFSWRNQFRMLRVRVENWTHVYW